MQFRGSTFEILCSLFIRYEKGSGKSDGAERGLGMLAWLVANQERHPSKKSSPDGSAGTCLVSIRVLDANDNFPVFYPTQYNITVREGYKPSGPLVVLSATDGDEGIFGEVHFHLKSGDPALYEVNEKSGEVFLKKGLTRGRHELTVQAKDGSGSSSEEPAHVYIYVIGSDASAPSFTQSNYVIKTPEDILPGISIGAVQATGPGTIRYRFPIDMVEITVSENQTVHEPFYIVHATDKDKRKNGAITYSILSSHPPCPVMVQPLTGQLQLTDPLDFENVKDYRIRIKAQDHGIPPRSTNMTLVVHVSDFNDNAPVFETTSYEAEVPENSPLMTAVLKVKARDADSRENGKVLYRITNGSSAFGIDEKTGMIYVNENIDREVQSVYNLTVTAQDQGEPSLSSSVPVRIHITDVNDNAPSCSSVATMVVPLDSTPATTVGTVVITDRDSGMNGTVVYRSQQSHPLFVVKSNDISNHFFITDGKLSMSSHPQAQPPWSLSLILSDKEGRQKHLSIKVLESNSAVPSEPVKLSPLLAIGSKVASLGSKSKQKNGGFYYSMKNQSSYFEVDQATGDIYLMRKIRDLEGRQISLPYNRIDALTSESEAKQIDFEIGSGSVDAPFFTDDVMRITVAEDAVIGTIVASVNASSPDPSAAPVYRLAEPSNRFAIDQYSGEVSVIEDLHWKEINLCKMTSNSKVLSFKSPHHLVVVASAGGGKTSMLLVVDVLDVNNNHPEIISANEVITFAEAGRIIHYVVATDDDYGRNATVSYDIIADNSNCFGIDHKTGALSMLRRPPTPETTITVRASDHGSPALFVDQILRIRITNGTKKWSYFADGELRVAISDTAPVGSIVTTLPVDGSSKYFEIDPRSGQLSCPALDREEQSEHLLVVVVQDGDRKDSCTVRITVADVNDNAPQFASSTLQVISINDTVALQDVVCKFSAFDHDVGANGRVLFDLVEDSSFAFDLVPETGELVLAREPERVGKDWMIRVKAHDKGVPSLAVDRFIRVQNSRSPPKSRDSQPSFLRQKYVSSIDEGLTRGQIVSKVATSSRDSRITYSIVEGNTDSAFEIDSEGVVRTSQELDYEIKDLYDLKIIATGAFANQIKTQMIVEVNNINDNPPVFPRQSRKKVLETLPVGSYLTTVTANDADNMGALEYSLDPKEERFVIDRFTGVVHLATGLDFETVEEIDVEVKVTDGNFNATTSFLVVVMDVNDNAPEFQQRFVDIKVPQSAGADEVIAKLVAFDRDSGDNGRVSYSLVDTHELFKLDGNDGTLTLLSPLPANADFLLTVTASDHGFPVMSSSIPVRVSVTREQAQERPQFLQDSYEFVVSESLTPHIVFGNVSVGKELYFYRVMDSRASEVFEVDHLGRLSLRVPLDRETKDRYTFTVEVGSQPVSYHQNSTTTVNVRVTDVNDNSPVFSHPNWAVTVRDGMRSGEVLQRLVATDADDAENGRISYRILSGDDYGIFSVAPDTGALMFNQWDDEQLVRHSDGKWTLFVEAKDHGSMRRSTILPVQISLELQTWSGSAPFFVVPGYVVPVLETTSRDSTVFTARATNRFGIPMSTVRYDLKDNDQTFSIDPVNGSIRLKQDLDYETKISYRMSLLASDTNGRSAVVPLEFIVLPVDEFPPVFSQPSYTFQVPLVASVGTIIGEIHAVDADGGVHGVPVYRIEPASDLVTVEKTTGVITLRAQPDKRRNHTVEQITVIAASNDAQQAKATVFLEVTYLPRNTIGDFPIRSANSAFSSNIFKIGAIATAALFVLLICLLGCCLFGYRSSKPKEIESPRKQVYSVSKGQANGANNGICRLASSPKPALPSNVSQKYTQSRHIAPTFQPLTEIFDELEEIQREQPKKREYIQVEI
ncbi:cadherin domain protein [Ancylostoma ceylanicum]|uniref:Cadherin domain protein n=1 Tax=Ancylostoma ceylanicum TaxID=53326 RepID=A0A0D6LYD2_9BILA|nr:cadherin domain protein [Ancylostoma ceylanicum]